MVKTVDPPPQHCISTYADDTCDAVAWMGPGFSEDEEEDAANAALIVFLRNHAPALLALAKRLADLERLREAVVNFEAGKGTWNQALDALAKLTTTGETK